MEHTNLHFAAENGHRGAVSFLLRGGAVVNAKDTAGNTPLFSACRGGHEEVVCTLLEANGAEINARNHRGWTALHLAAVKGHTGVVSILVDRGAEVNAESTKGWTPLLVASGSGHAGVVSTLLRNGAEMNATVFHAAVSNGHTGEVSMLVEGGAGLNTEDGEGNTPLIHACRGGHEEVVRMLLKAGVVINTKNNNTHTALHAAAGQGHTRVVSMLVEDRGTEVNAKDDTGSTPLFFASDGGHEEVVDTLLEVKGAEINAKNDVGWTVLHVAAAKGHSGVVCMLVDGGAEVNAKDDKGLTPLTCACRPCRYKLEKLDSEKPKRGTEIENVELAHALQHKSEFSQKEFDAFKVSNLSLNSYINVYGTYFKVCVSIPAGGHTKVVGTLLNLGAEINTEHDDNRIPSALESAASLGHHDIVCMLVHHTPGAPINKLNFMGKTPLFYASSRGHEQVVDTLLMANAEVNAKNDIHGSALHAAVSQGHFGVVSMLVNLWGAEVNAKDGQGNTPLFNAIDSGHTDVVATLLRAGAKVNVENAQNMQPLHAAARREHTGLVSMLVGAKADVTSKDCKGSTPFFYSCLRGHEEVVYKLLAAGAEINAKNNNRRTALHTAARFGHKGTVSMLVNWKAQVEAQDCNGNTPLFDACVSGHEEVVGMLFKQGAEIRVKNARNRTALHADAGKGSTGLVSLLISWGAEVDTQDTLIFNVKDDRGWTPIFDACLGGHEKVVGVLLGAGAMTNIYSNGKSLGLRNLSPLHIACRQGNGKIVSALLEADAEINAVTVRSSAWCDGCATRQPELVNAEWACADCRDFDLCGLCYVHFSSSGKHHIQGHTFHKKPGQNAFEIALDYGHIEIASMLIEMGVDSHGCTKLHLVCSGGDADAVAALLKAGSEVNALDAQGRTPLFYACEGHKDGHSHDEVVRVLLKARAEVNVRRNDSETVLHIACKGGQNDIVSMLLNSRADLDMTDNEGSTPLHFACLECVCQCCRASPKLVFGCGGEEGGWRSTTDVVNTLLMTGAQVNSKQEGVGWTPLMTVASRGFGAKVFLLLKKGVEINARDIGGRTALDYACEKGWSQGHQDVVKYLLDAGADLRVRTNSRQTPLHATARHREKRGTRSSICAEMLINKCPDLIYDVDWNKESALHFAAKHGHPHVMQVLLKWRANPNLQNKFSKTPMQLCTVESEENEDAGSTSDFGKVLILLKEAESSLVPRLTKDYVTAHVDAGNALSLSSRADDEESMFSMTSAFSGVSMHLSRHAAQRLMERKISDGECQQVKKGGFVCLAIRLKKNQKMDSAKVELYHWASRLEEALVGLTAGDAVTKQGTQGDHRLEVQLYGSEKKGLEIKKWLTEQGYFQSWRCRVMYSQRQKPEDFELVVIEGLIKDEVIVITSFLRSKSKVLPPRDNAREESV